MFNLVLLSFEGISPRGKIKLHCSEDERQKRNMTKEGVSHSYHPYTLSLSPHPHFAG